MEMVKPHFDGDAALRVWIERQLEKVMREYAMQFIVSPAAKDKSEDIYQRVKALEQDPASPRRISQLTMWIPPASGH